MSVNPVNRLQQPNVLLQSSGKVKQNTKSVSRYQRVVINPQKCTGCRMCELACAFVHANDDGSPGLSRIKIQQVGSNQYVPLTCLQCIHAACVKVCPTQALIRNEHTGAIELKPERCVGCALCEVACPFGLLHFDSQTHVPIKCDLCKGEPKCVRFCPSGALEIR